VAALINSNELRVLAYALAALACLAAGWRERRARSLRELDLWPAFWTLTAIVLGAMALARALDLADALTEVGRREARLRGLYEARRSLQALLVGGIGLAWFVTVLTAIWRVPERRRRYLPAFVFVFSLGCFAALRTVSFHYLDAVLYNRPVLGVRAASVLELGGTALAAAAGAWRAWKPEVRLYRGQRR
jgi:hypothetical protein